MPTKTFFNLPEEKKERLMVAASKEFSRVPLTEASINCIVKDAGISRGSFYQYFEDKEDLYYYKLSNWKQNNRVLLIDCLKQAEGDLFEGFLLFCPKMLEMIMGTSQFNFYRHLFTHMDYRTSREVSPESMRHAEEKKRTLGAELREVVDMSLLNLQDEEELNELAKFLIASLTQTITEGFAKEYTQEETAEVFYRRLNWIKYGARKTTQQEEEKC